MGFFSRFVDSNDREVKRIQPLVDAANALEPELEGESDAEIRARVDEIRAELAEVQVDFGPTQDERDQDDPERRRDMEKARRKRENERLQAAMDEALPEVFACAREAMRRTLGMRHFDVQLIGGAVLHQGKIAEMKTGEGKTLVAPLAAILNGLTGRGVHLVTVNDYLARRDPQWMGPVYHFLGLSVGIIVHDTAYVFEPGYPTSDERLINLRPGRPPRGVRGRHHLRHEQRVRLRLPPRQHGHRARGARPARALLRHRRRGRQHPHRRGPDPADHQRPGRGVGRPLLHVRPPGSQAPGPPRGRRGGRGLLRRPQGQGRLADRGRHRPDGAARSASRTSTTPTRASPATSSRRSGPMPSSGATRTTSSRTARSSSSTSSPAA